MSWPGQHSFARIIIVDDDAITCAACAKILAAEGHEVRTASDVFACRAALNAAPADVVILDLGLPGVDGLAYAAELQHEDDVGVIVVTGRTDLMTRIAALDEGADDFLIKPVHPGELAARVRSLVRRRERGRSRRYQVGPWTIDLDRRTIVGSGGRVIATTRGEFDLLAQLVEARGKIVSREALSETVSRGGGTGDIRSVDALVSRLRRKLVTAEDPAPILTAPGFGYRLGPPAEPI